MTIFIHSIVLDNLLHVRAAIAYGLCLLGDDLAEGMHGLLKSGEGSKSPTAEM